ncbi:MAG: EAL domain-containing protein [Kineosporiaceae bacterium]
MGEARVDGSGTSQAEFMSAVSQARERVRLALARPVDLLRELAEAVAFVVEAPATVALLDGGCLVRRAVTAGAALPEGTVIPVAGTVCGEAAVARRAVRIDDVDDIPEMAGQAVHPGDCCPGGRSLLSVPILDGSRIVGVLAAASGTPEWFDAMDERALALIAQVAAAGLADVPPWFDAPLSGVPDLPGGPEVHPGGIPSWITASRSPASPAPSHQAATMPADVDGFRLAGAPSAADAVLSRGLAAFGGTASTPGLGVWEWRVGAGEILWSAELFRILGYEPGEFSPTPQGCAALVHPEDRRIAATLDDLVQRVEDGEDEAGATETFRVAGADGALRHLQVWAVATRDADGAGAVVVHGAVVDVTRQARDRVLLERLSATDPVTGLGNRLAFDRRMKELLAAPESPDVSLLLLDLDRFKLVNDSLGHQVGDRLLGEVARRLRDVVPEGSITARMGGDEFVVVPPAGLEWLHVRRLAQALVDTLRAPYVLPDTGEILVCPASLGLTSTAGREVGANELLSEADLALYRAKDSGRDRYVVYDDALRARARSRHNAELLLRSALELDRLVLQYQPIVAFETGRMVGVEALVRAIDPTGERLLPPDTFIEIAEDTGLVVELDLWVIDAATEQLARWLASTAMPEMVPWVAVNVSALSMEHPRVIRRLLDGMQQHRLNPERMKVELTEHTFLGVLPGGESTLRQLLTSGVPVGIDDFGTGYSAMAYLNRFDLDFMKIDRSFVALVGQEDRADAVVTAIVDLAHAHGMQVTAEGVETQRQARRLREIGCDFAQGYHFGRPMDPARLIPATL